MTKKRSVYMWNCNMYLGSSTHCVPRIHDVKDIQTSKFNHHGSSYCYSSLCIDFNKSLIQDVSVLATIPHTNFQESVILLLGFMENCNYTPRKLCL